MPRSTARLRVTGIAAVACASLMAGILVAPAGAVTLPRSSIAPRLVGTGGGPGDTARSLLTLAGHPIPRPSGLADSASPSAVARAVVAQHATELGIRGTLATGSTQPSIAGGTVVRLEQTFGGVPVIGGDVVVDVNLAGGTRSISSEVLPGAAPSTTPVQPARAATATALRRVARSARMPATSLSASTPTLAIYDPRIFGAGGPGVSTLVWRVEVRGGVGVRHLVLVDATHGYTTLDLDEVDDAVPGPQRAVCDAASQAVEVPCTTVVRSEGDPPAVGTNSDDVNHAYDYAGDTWDFYSSRLHRDVNFPGTGLTSTVRYCPPPPDPQGCPYPNAFWDGTQMVYGEGMPAADDVVGHELTHGVTQQVNGLYYFFQSGAINESLSDIFGEFIDQTNTNTNYGGTDTPDVAWIIGEDLPAPYLGGLRNMKDPTSPPTGGSPQPDRTGSTLYEAHPVQDQPSFDNGGVHTNSGVGNKFAYLLTDGDTFNGHTVVGVGITKAADIIFGASQRLTSGADYRAFATALRASCTALVDASTDGIAAGDCTQVDEAIKAVEMDRTPVQAPLAAAPTCPANNVTATRFFDTMENSATHHWVATGTKLSWSGHPSAAPLWFYGHDVGNPEAANHVYATSGIDNLWGMDPDPSTTTFGSHPSQSNHAIEMRTAVRIPSGSTFLRFDHAFGFDSDPFGKFDGGRVEYAIGSSTTWHDAGALFRTRDANGYGFNTGGVVNSLIDPVSGSAIAGQAAFTGESQGYTASRATLTSLAGKLVRFRFRVYADSQLGDAGWFIDNVRIYSCMPLLNVSVPPSVALGAAKITWAANDRLASSGATYRVRTARVGSATWVTGPLTPAPTSRVLSVPLPTGGGTTCVAFRASDPLTPASSNLQRCQTRPVDDRLLVAGSRPAWSSVRSPSSFAGTLRVTRHRGATLTLRAARGRSLVLVAETVRGGGSVGIFVRGRRVAVISLASSRTVLRKQFSVVVPGLVGVPVVVKVLTSGRTVGIDGLAARP